MDNQFSYMQVFNCGDDRAAVFCKFFRKNIFEVIVISDFAAEFFCRVIYADMEQMFCIEFSLKNG